MQRLIPDHTLTHMVIFMAEIVYMAVTLPADRAYVMFVPTDPASVTVTDHYTPVS